MARSRGVQVLGIVVAVVAALTLAFVMLGSVRVPLRFDADGVRSLQLNGGTLTLVDSGDPELRASVPLRLLPILMARRTDDVLEIGGFDDSDIRVLFSVFMPFAGVPASVDDVEWELCAPDLERVTVAGGRMVAQGYSADRFAVFGVTGEAELGGLEVGTLAVHTQDPAIVRVSGYAETFSSMDSGGTLDASGLTYGSFDRQVIVDYFD